MEIFITLMVLLMFAVGSIITVMLGLDIIFKSNITAVMCSSIVSFFRKNVEEIK